MTIYSWQLIAITQDEFYKQNTLNCPSFQFTQICGYKHGFCLTNVWSAFINIFHKISFLEYIECPGGEAIYAKGDDECDIVATCVLDGADEANCRKLQAFFSFAPPSIPPPPNPFRHSGGP